MSEADQVATPEPAPRAGRRSVVDDLKTLLESRREFGRRKYGTELETFNGRDAYVDALQELIDLFQYLHQAQMERAALEAELDQVKGTLQRAEQLLEEATRQRDEARRQEETINLACRRTQELEAQVATLHRERSEESAAHQRDIARAEKAERERAESDLARVEAESDATAFREALGSNAKALADLRAGIGDMLQGSARLAPAYACGIAKAVKDAEDRACAALTSGAAEPEVKGR